MMLASGPKLKTALVLNSFAQPAWINRIVRLISASSFAEMCLVIKIDCPPRGVRATDNTGFCATALRQASSIVDSQSKLAYPDPLEQSNILENFEKPAVITVETVLEGQSLHLTGEAVRTIRAYDIDVVLDFGDWPLTGSAPGIAKHGVWRGTPLGTGENGQPAGGFWEVMKAIPTMEFGLRVMKPNSLQDRLIYRSFTSADLYSVKGTQSKVYWKSASAVLRCLEHLHARGPSYLENGSIVPAAPSSDSSLESLPTSWNSFVFLTKIAGRKIARTIRNSYSMERWYLAFTFGESPLVTNESEKFKYMIPPKDVFWADPFPVAKNGRYYVFIEEFVYATMKGHISVIEMEPDGTWKPPLKVLDTDYHLSYPFVFEWEGNVYMIPESKRNKTVELYRCVEFPSQWRLEKILIENIQAVDSTLYLHEGTWWLFCNIGGNEFSSNDELHVFYADTPFGPWTAHRDNPVKSDVRSSRPAGRLFHWNGDLHRPSQDCSLRMGGAMCINRIEELSKKRFREREVARIEPSWKRGLLGTHTLNSSGNLHVLDCFDYTPKFL